MLNSGDQFSMIPNKQLVVKKISEKNAGHLISISKNCWCNSCNCLLSKICKLRSPDIQILVSAGCFDYTIRRHFFKEESQNSKIYPLFSLFVLGLGVYRCGPWGQLLSFCLTVLTIFAEFPEIMNSLPAIGAFIVDLQNISICNWKCFWCENCFTILVGQIQSKLI